MYVEKTNSFGRMEWFPDGHLECSDYPVCKCCGGANEISRNETQPVWLCLQCKDEIIGMTLGKILKPVKKSIEKPKSART